MAGCMKGTLRATTGLLGDVEGDISGIEKGSRKNCISVEDGKVIFWVVGMDDKIITAEDITSWKEGPTNVRVRDMASGGGKQYDVDYYEVGFKGGKTGTVRLIKMKYEKDSNGHERCIDVRQKSMQVLKIWGK